MKKCWRYDFRSAFVIFAALLVSGCHGVDREPICSPAAANQRAHQELGRGRGFRVEWLLRRGTTHMTLNLMSRRWTYRRMFLFLQLDEMCITFDGGKTRLNFAEAALLIQGSTCIYSKKVNYVNPVCGNSPKPHSDWVSSSFRWSSCTVWFTKHWSTSTTRTGSMALPAGFRGFLFWRSTNWCFWIWSWQAQQTGGGVWAQWTSKQLWTWWHCSGKKQEVQSGSICANANPDKSQSGVLMVIVETSHGDFCFSSHT